MTREITYRGLAGRAEREACVRLQRETWGEDFAELVSAGLLEIVQKIGGIVLGAFDGERMVGFVLGLAGFRDGEPIQWSHMLAVSPEARGRGIGRALKLRQRERALERGIRRIYWTFDPLQARNAHLNLNRLGVEIVEYVPDMYGSDTRSPLHPGGSTDRLVAEWRLESQRARRAVAGERVGPPLETIRDVRPLRVDLAPEEPADTGDADPLPDLGAVRIRIPCDLLALARRDPETARRCRLATRRAFPFYLGRGYEVRAFYREGAEGGSGGEPCCFYYLERRKDG